MKKITIFLQVAILSLFLFSCDSTSMAFGEMQGICEDIEKNFDKYTEEDFEKLSKRFEKLEEKMEERELTDKEKRELAKLKGRYYGAFTKGAIKSTKKEIKKISDEVESAVEGFLDGLK